MAKNNWIVITNLLDVIALSRGAKSTLTEKQLDALHDQILRDAYTFAQQQNHDLQVEKQLLKQCLSGNEETKPSWFKRISGFVITSLVLGTAVMLFHKVVEIMLEKTLEKAASSTLATLTEISNLMGVLW